MSVEEEGAVGGSARNHEGGDAEQPYEALFLPLKSQKSLILMGNQTVIYTVAATRTSRRIELLIISLAQLRKLMHN